EERAPSVAGAHRPGPLLADGGDFRDLRALQPPGASPFEVDLGVRQVAPEERAQDLVEQRRLAHGAISTPSSRSAGAVAHTGSFWPPLAHQPAPAGLA